MFWVLIHKINVSDTSACINLIRGENQLMSATLKIVPQNPTRYRFGIYLIINFKIGKFMTYGFSHVTYCYTFPELHSNGTTKGCCLKNEAFLRPFAVFRFLVNDWNLFDCSTHIKFSQNSHLCVLRSLLYRTIFKSLSNM